MSFSRLNALLSKDAPAIITVPTNKNVIENARPDIDCSSNITPGNPSTTRYRWTGPGEYSKDGAVLDRLVNRNQGGMYTCTATNTAGLSDTAQANINVQYAPVIADLPPNNNVIENASPDIDCSSNITPGNPSTTRFRWTGPGEYSKDGAVLDRLVKRNQGGMYTCTATNNAGLSDTAKVNINVQCTATCQSQPDRLGHGIGIGVGVSLPVVLVLVVIIVLMWRRNHELIEKVNTDQTETIEIQSQGHSTPNQDGAYASLDEHAPQNNEYEKLDMANSEKDNGDC
ncbi:B-cell receptor CD22-like [Haliotis rufescens]|uniref:B-cell receptor CD22-like n=1 Tax=Haliotis rufescens TaxID=6454 RepID=UPI00201EFEE6|nr:B-cell receptor CD22-like [Haliotis rufescens]